MNLLLSLSFLIPLVGVCIAGMPFPERVGSRLRRWLYVLILVSVCVLLIWIGADTLGAIRLPFGSTLVGYDESPDFSFDALGISFATLFIGILTLVGVAGLARGMERFEALSSLLLIAAGIGAFSSDNLLALCIAWGLADLALLGLNIIGAPEDSLPHAVRSVWGNLASTLVLIMATVLITASSGQTDFIDLRATDISSKLLLLATLLRLGVHPLPGSVKRHWQTSLASLCMGGCLWLRIVSVSPHVLALPDWLMVLGGWLLLATGLLAALAPDFATALPLVLLNGTVVVILGPSLDSAMGFPVAFLAIANLGVCLGLSEIDAWVSSIHGSGHWARAPLIVALVSLIGFPLTLGFASRWSFLSLCCATGSRNLFLLGFVSFLLASMPAWQHLCRILSETREDVVVLRWDGWVAFAIASLMAAILAALGFNPVLLEYVWPGRPELGLPSLGRLFWNESNWRLLALAALGWLMGSYALQRALGGIPNALSRVLDALGALLELNWLYLVIESVTSRLARLATTVLTAIEESLCLGWTLVWGLAITFYLLEG